MKTFLAFLGVFAIRVAVFTPCIVAEEGPAVEQSETVYKDDAGKVLWRGKLTLFKMGLFNPRAFPPVVSPDFSRMAYGLCDDELRRRQLVIDGKPGKEYDNVVHAVFSPDSQTVVYWAESKGEGFLVTNGREGPHYKFAAFKILFSPDSRRMAYTTMTPLDALVLDGQSLKPSGRVEEMAFSPDSQHFAFRTKDKGKESITLDGRTLVSGDEVVMPATCFTPDSQSFVYACRNNVWWTVVFGDARYGPYDEVSSLSLTISSDSKRIAFPARVGSDWFIVTPDGKLGPYAMRPSALFSPDSKRLLHYGKSKDAGVSAFLDGQLLGTFDTIQNESFSPDGKHCAFLATNGEKSCLVVDGKAEHENIVHFAFNPVDGQIAALSLTDKKLQLSYKGQNSKPYDPVQDVDLTFSPDGRHLAFWAVRDRQSILVVDGLVTARFNRWACPGLIITKENRIRGAALHNLKPESSDSDGPSIEHFKKELVNTRMVLFELIPEAK